MSFSWVLLPLLLLLISSAVIVVAEEDLYKILGVERTATKKEIKAAYRRKALDTHPDKRRDVPEEQATEEFRQLVDAFETLSDDESRRNYDLFNSRSSPGGNQGDHRRYYRSSGFTYRQPRHVRERSDVRAAMARVMHIVSLEQLKTVMLNDDGLLERNLLISFVTPHEVETFLDDEMVYPWPFAGYSPQKIWWEDLLQTVKVRYRMQNDLTRFFAVDGDQIRSSAQPVFFFGRRGKPLGELRRLQTADRQKFQDWVWECLEVKVVFKNEHTHPVELFWIHGARATLNIVLQPGESSYHNTMLSHEWRARDARVDTHKGAPGRKAMSKNSSLGIWKIVSDKPGQVFRIRSRKCIDLSGHCTFWQRRSECRRNPQLMAELCRLTCNLCDVGEVEDGKDNTPNLDGEVKEKKHDEF